MHARIAPLPCFFALSMLLACQLEAGPDEPLGSLSLALTSQAAGVTYRLTDARFALEGPEPKGFASGEEDQVNLELLPGAYTLELLPGYRLVRADDPAGTTVAASLLSENPAPLLVEPGVSTAVTLRFELADGSLLSNQRGMVAVGLELGTSSADAGAHAACSEGLRIDEIDYDQPSSDDSEFVELLNGADCAADLSKVVLELINGSDGKVYASYPLAEAGALLPAGGRLVVGDPGVLAGLPAEVLRIPLKTLGLQNGPDGVRLAVGTQVLDGVAYEAALAGTGEGEPSATDEAELALARCPAGFDSNHNGLDFQLRPPTPGLAAACE